jgi:hypothetical protein
MKNYVNDTLKPREADPPKKGGLPPNNDDDAGAMYPDEDGTMHMIFGGFQTRPSRRREKLIRREVFSANTAKPSYLKWPEVPMTFDQQGPSQPRAPTWILLLVFVKPTKIL